MFEKKKDACLIDYKSEYENLQKDFDSAINEHEIEIDEITRKHEHAIKDLKKDIELKEKDFKFQLAHQESEVVRAKDIEIIKLTKDLAVANEKITMLDKIVDLNSDVIDVKKLVEQLINKLPEVKISTVAVSTSDKK